LFLHHIGFAVEAEEELNLRDLVVQEAMAAVVQAHLEDKLAMLFKILAAVVEVVQEVAVLLEMVQTD
jgi:hypothetical protein